MATPDPVESWKAFCAALANVDLACYFFGAEFSEFGGAYDISNENPALRTVDSDATVHRLDITSGQSGGIRFGGSLPRPSHPGRVQANGRLARGST